MSFITGFISLFLIFSCSPVRTRYNLSIQKLGEDQELTKRVDSNSMFNISNIDTTDIFHKESRREQESYIKIDTLVIDLADSKNDYVLIENFQKANDLFKQGEYKSALKLYLSIKKNLPKSDERFWLVQIRISDCLEEIGEIEQSIRNLEQLYSLVESAHPFRPIIMLKLAHLYCRVGKKAIYEYFRNLLEQNYPDELKNLHSCK